MYKNIFEAIRANDKQAVELFLNSGVSLESMESDSQCVASELAAKLGYDEICGLIYEHEVKDQPAIASSIGESENDVVLASHSQKRFYFLHETIENSATYHEYELVQFQGKLNVHLIETALYQLMQRHEIMRSRYKFNNHGALCYEVLNKFIVPLAPIDAVGEEVFSIDNFLVKEKMFMQKTFNLCQELSWRVKLFHISENTYSALFVFHHIMMDGFSLSVIFKDLSKLLQLQLNQEQELILTAPALQFRQFSQWEHEWQATAEFQKQQLYWETRLEGYASDIVFQPDIAISNADQYSKKQGRTAIYSISKEMHQSLMNTAKQNKVTPFILYLTAYFILTNKYTQQDDMIIGTPFINRGLERSETAVGCFINTLPIRCKIGKDQTLGQLIQDLNKCWQYDLSNGQLPYDVIMQNVASDKKHAQDHVIQIFFAYQLGMELVADAQVDSVFSMQAQNIEHRLSETAQFSLTFEVIENNDNINFLINYRSDLYSDVLVDRLFNQYCDVLNTLIVSPEMQIKTISVLTEQERYQQLIEWNQTEKACVPTTLHELFETQAARTPNNIALVYEDQTMTYAELNARANQVARYLRSEGVGPDDLVGLGTKRSFEMMIGMLAVLKAGGAYVPLDPVHPDERLRHMLQDTKIKYLLTQSNLISRWENLSDVIHCFTTIALDNVTDFVQYSNDDLTPIAKPHHLAYVIYTSGSTGQPKGTMVEHAGIVNICREMSQLLQMHSNAHVAQFASMNFDAMVIQWSTALTQGARLYLLSSGSSVLESLFQVLENYPIEIMDLTPSVLTQIPDSHLSHIKTLVVAGESLNQSLLDRWKGRCRLINAYGPTEASVCVTAHVINPANSSLASCIGRPIANTQLYILDESQQLLPVGATGELYLGGVGLARGYLNQEIMTQERFVWHKFSEDSEPVRLYRTGDLVRYLPNSDIEYIGRADHQIKIRGFRVELGEIEAQLLKQADIAEAAVLVQGEGSDKKLIAYLVSAKAWVEESAVRQTFIQTLRKQLVTFLPDYMVPTHLMLIEKMPLTINGKINRKALESIVIEVSSNNNYVAPTTVIEKQLAEVWSDLVHVSKEKIGIHDNFFDIGGNSILAMQFVSQAKKRLALEMTVGQFYQTPTIAAIVHAQHNDSLTLDPCFIPFFVDANKPTLFLVHEFYGMAMGYTRVVPAIKEKFSIYGINYPNLMSGEIIYYDSLQALAADYVKKIRKLVPNGPYHLGGWSFGGNIALEMTSLLQAQGETVETLLILDSINFVYVEYIELYTEITAERALSFQNITGEALQRSIIIGKHLAEIIAQNKAKRISRPVPYVYLIKCQGSAAELVGRYLAGVNWRIKDVLNGLRHHFPQGQRVYIQDIACPHHLLLEDENAAILNARIKTLFEEEEDDAYLMDEETQPILKAREKKAPYLEKGLSMEIGRFDTDFKTITQNTEEQKAFAFYGEPQQLINMARAYQMHQLDVWKLLPSLSLNKKLVMQIFQLMLKISPRYASLILVQMVQKLLIMRLASMQSISLFNAFMLDDIYVIFLLQVAQKLTLSYWNYLNIAIERGENFRVGETFDAALWICGAMTIPMCLYAIFSQQIGESLGLNDTLINDWYQLAFGGSRGTCKFATLGLGTALDG